MSPTQRAEHGRRLVTALCTLLLVAGLALIAVFVHAQVSPVEPALTSSRQADREAMSTPTPPPASITTRVPTSTPTLPSTAATTSPTLSAAPRSVAKPVSVTIASIGVTSVLNPTGVDAAGEIQVPARGPHYDQASWFTGSPRPGQAGPAVIIGHLDGPVGRTSIFFELGSLRPGDRVTVTRADHSVVSFEVYRVERYAKDDFPTVAVYGNTTAPELRLITCGGELDRAIGYYRDNTVVYARILSTS